VRHSQRSLAPVQCSFAVHRGVPQTTASTPHKTCRETAPLSKAPLTTTREPLGYLYCCPIRRRDSARPKRLTLRLPQCLSFLQNDLPICFCVKLVPRPRCALPESLYSCPPRKLQLVAPCSKVALVPYLLTRRDFIFHFGRFIREPVTYKKETITVLNLIGRGRTYGLRIQNKMREQLRHS
jgi:hypothetical protein